MKLITIDTAKCVSCTKCVVMCPMGIIKMHDNGFPEPTENAFQLCINCGYCVDVCAFDALYHLVRKNSTGSKSALKRYDLLQKKKRRSNEK